jgi:hypothetical protein
MFSKTPTSWKIILDRMIGNVAVSEVDVLRHVAISKTKKNTCLMGD